jgi:alpha-galactosidase
MSDVKIALLGAGSFVFGPSFLNDVLVDHRFGSVHLALMDPNGPVVELMAGLGRRLAADHRVRCTITAHTERAPALEGADFVVCSAARELHRRFGMDCDIAARHDPSHLISEFGGIAGISYSLRQIALIQEICADMRRLCPNATLLNTANPLPRVCQAAHEEGIPTVGFCSAAIYVYDILWRILHGSSIDYPFEPAASRLDMLMGGPNHFSWIVHLRDRATGRDLYPDLIARVRAGATAGHRMTERLLLETGFLVTPGDGHIKDFLPPTGEVPSRPSPGHGSHEERQRRLDLLRDLAEGKVPFTPTALGRSWERPADLIVSIVTGRTLAFPALNLVNAGQMPGLPLNVYVETPATADARGAMPQTVELPPQPLRLSQSAARVTAAIVRAARERNRGLLKEAVELDPTITDKRAGWAAVEQCLAAHADVLPAYT